MGYKNQIQILYKYSLMSIFFLLPFWGLFFKIIFILTFLLSILNFKKDLFKKISNNFHITSFFLLYIILALSLLYSENSDYGIKVLSRDVYFLIIPLIFCVNLDTESRLNTLLKMFLIGCLFSSLLCFLNSCYNTYIYASVNPFNKSNGNFFSYFNFTSIINLHPIYYGINLIIACSILFHSIIKNGNKLKLKLKLKLTFLIWLVVIIFFLNSILLISLLFIIFSINIYISVKKELKVKMVLLVTSLIIIIGFLSSHFIEQKIKGIEFKKDILTTDFTGNNFTAIKARKAKAYCSIKLISDNFFLGVGVGDGNEELIKYFKKYNFTYGANQKFNSHNQFLTIFIFSGFLGFLIFLQIFIYLFYKSIYLKNYYLLIITIVFFAFCLTESVFEREYGVVSFALFVMCFSQSRFNNSF